MKITRVKIENFRSIRTAEFLLNNFNIIVGQNNCGKTNFFEAIDFFYNSLGKGIDINDLKFKGDPANEILVEIEFSGAQHGAEQMLNQANKTKIKNAINESDIVVFSKSSQNSSKRKVFVGGVEITPGTGFDAALNDFLPKFEYISTKQYYDSVAKYSKTTPIGVMLSGVLTTILQENEPYREFQQTFKNLFEDENSQIRTEFDRIGGQVKVYLERQFPDCTKVKFEVTAPAFDDLLKNFDTIVDDGIETLAEEKGDGMQRALMLAIIQAYADFRRTNNMGKSFLFFIDEAELHLHPTAQRKLKDVLYTLSQQNDQVFINTHSSVLVADDYAGQSIFKSEKVSGETSIEKVTDSGKPYVVFELLGGSPTDLLLPCNFLIVEGISEFEFLTRIISRFYNDMPKIHIIVANGDIDQTERSINAIDKIYSPLNTSIYKNRLVILSDLPHQDRQGGVDNFLKKYAHLRANNQYFVLPARDIEQCYPYQPCTVYTNWKKTQAELDAVNAKGEKTFTGEKKKKLAKYIGNNITQAQFEIDMDTCFQALTKCWQEAYN